MSLNRHLRKLISSVTVHKLTDTTWFKNCQFNKCTTRSDHVWSYNVFIKTCWSTSRLLLIKLSSELFGNLEAVISLLKRNMTPEALLGVLLHRWVRLQHQPKHICDHTCRWSRVWSEVRQDDWVTRQTEIYFRSLKAAGTNQNNQTTRHNTIDLIRWSNTFIEPWSLETVREADGHGGECSSVKLEQPLTITACVYSSELALDVRLHI